MKVKISIMIVMSIIAITAFTSVFMLIKTYDKLNQISLNETQTKEKNENISSNKNNTLKEESIPASVVVDDIYAYSSKYCFKKTLYTAKDGINIYENPNGNSKIVRTLSENEPLVVYNETEDYLYCEESTLGLTGWVKKSSSFKKYFDYKDQYSISVNLTDQNLKVYKDDKLLKDMPCSTGITGNKDTETPIGKFKIILRGEEFFSEKFNQGAKYYLQFFGDYLIHSVPVDKNGNIIKEEEEKLGEAVSHGCIRVPMEDAKWLYDNIPDGGEVYIHY